LPRFLVLVTILSMMAAGDSLAQQAQPAAEGGKKLTPAPPSETPAVAPAPATPAAPVQEGTAPPAQGTGTQPARQPRQQPDTGLGKYLPFIMIGLLVLMFWWMSRSRKKKEAQRREMLSALKKGDKVTSIGGICGTIVEVRDDELVVKVDENNNMRLRFARWAIRGAGEQAKKQEPEENR